jgi:hypothetical protein
MYNNKVFHAHTLRPKKHLRRQEQRRQLVAALLAANPERPASEIRRSTGATEQSIERQRRRRASASDE